MDDNAPSLQTGMRDRILGRIRRGDVAMHSRLYFVLKIAGFIIVLLLALIISVLLITFILFTIRVNIQNPLMHVGPRALFFFAHVFPWYLLGLDVVLIALAEWMLRSFKFAYRSPTLYVLFAMLVFVLAVGLFLDRGTSFNEGMLEHARRHHLPPPLNEMYENARHDEIMLIDE